MKKMLFVLFVLPMVIAKGQTVLKDQLTTYQGSLYSIEFPSGWTLDTISSKLSGVDAFLFSAPESAVDSFRENINILHHQLSAGINTLEQMIDSTKPMIKAYFHLDNFINCEKHTLNGVEYFQLEYPIEQNGITLHCDQFYYLHSKTIFVVTLSMQLGKEKIFKKAGEKIMASFKFRD